MLNDVAVDGSSRSRLRAAVQAQLEDEEDVQADDVLLGRFFEILDDHRYANEAAEGIGAAKVHFIVLLGEYERRCRDEGDYAMAEAFADIERTIRDEEKARRVGGENEDRHAARLRLVAAHDAQFAEYTNSWDLCMEEFEQKGKAAIENLASTHGQQLEALESSTGQRRDITKKKWSKELIQLRERQTMLAEQKLYVMVRMSPCLGFPSMLYLAQPLYGSPSSGPLQAQATKDKADKLEAEEKAKMNSGLDKSLERNRESLLARQDNEANAMAKRITGKRTKLEKRRVLDTDKLLLRNRNIVKAYDEESRSRFRRIEGSVDQAVRGTAGISG